MTAESSSHLVKGNEKILTQEPKDLDSGLKAGLVTLSKSLTPGISELEAHSFCFPAWALVTNVGGLSMLPPHSVCSLVMFGTGAQDFFFFFEAYRRSCDEYIEEHYLAVVAFWHFVLSQLEDSKKSTITITWLLLPPPPPFCRKGQSSP